MIRTLRAQLAAKQDVPREPTKAMKEAGVQAMHRWIAGEVERAAAMYRAMYDAARKPGSAE